MESLNKAIKLLRQYESWRRSLGNPLAGPGEALNESIILVCDELELKTKPSNSAIELFHYMNARCGVKQ